MSTTGEIKNRMFGLDILRSIAVMSVVFGHSLWLLYGNIRSGTLFDSIFIFTASICGYMGVEIFFVLSGFLIGSIFINEFSGLEDKSSIHKRVGSFWIKRWFRTIPNYYLYILIYLCVYSIMNWTHGLKEFNVRYFFFTHNFFHAGPGFLGVSWSLSVEEWFYLLLPLSFSAVFLARRKPRPAIILTFLLLLFIPMLLRLNFVLQHPHQDKVLFHFGFTTIYRLDSIAYGTFIAWIWKNDYLRDQIVRIKNRLFILGIISLFSFLLFNVFSVQKPDQNSFLALITYPWASISISLFFPAMITFRNATSGFFSNRILFTSKISYSLYLAHPLLIGLAEEFKKPPYVTSTIYTDMLSFVSVISGSFLLAWLTYKFCEQPFLKWREVVIDKYLKYDQQLIKKYS